MNIIPIIFSLFVLLFAITIHEAAHGWTAAKLGDPTAQLLGRVTLNPLPHIDPVGTLIFPIMLAIFGFPVFGWAKPVPVNPMNLRNPRKDNIWISAAGPFANLSVAFLSLITIFILKFISPGVGDFFRNFFMGRGTLPPGFYPLHGLALILFYAVIINTYLAIFNLIPVPPLDGSGILMGILSEQAAEQYDRLRPFGFLIILALIYLGVLNIIIRPVQILIYTLIFF